MKDNLQNQVLPPAPVDTSPSELSSKYPASGGISKLHRVVKYPVRLAAEEERKFDKSCMFLRWFWNDMLAYLQVNYAVGRCFSEKVKLPSEFDGTPIIKELRNDDPESEHLKQVSFYALKDVWASLIKSYRTAVSGKSKKDKRGHGGWPEFKGKRSPINSIAFDNIALRDEEIWLGNFLYLGARIWSHKRSDETIQEARLVKTVAGFKVHVSLRSDAPVQVPINVVAGLDVGLKDLVTRSDGVVFNFTAHTEAKIERLEKRLRRRKRKLSRCQRRSGNRRRIKRKVALTYAKINRIREHAVHAVASELVKGVDAVVIEGFNPHNLCGGTLGGAIHAVAFSKLWSAIRHQCARQGKTVVEAPSNFASSKLCSRCGEKNAALALGDRTWACVCGAVHSRDLNAAINLEQFGVARLSESGLLSVKDGASIRTPTEHDSLRSDHGMSCHKEGRETVLTQWVKRSSVEPPGLVRTVTRGNLLECESTLSGAFTEGALYAN